MILLDARAFVINVQRRGHVLRHHASTEPRSRGTRYPAIEDQLDFFWAAQVEVFADHLLEEQATVHRSIEHLRGRELGLQDRDVIAVASLAVRRGEGMWQQP